MFYKATLLITGGTGSFGNAILRRFLKTEKRKIHIFSREEKKQDEMRQGSEAVGAFDKLRNF